MSRPDAKKTLDKVRAVIADYLPPDSGITAKEALSRIIRILESGSPEPGPSLRVIEGDKNDVTLQRTDILLANKLRSILYWANAPVLLPYTPGR